MSAWETIGQSDDWLTPKYIFDALNTTFDFDPAPHPRAAFDGLNIEWRGFVWLNPPFGKRNAIEPWLGKFIKHGNGIVLTPDRTSAPWFQRAASQMDSFLFLSPKVKFIRPDGSIGKSPGCGTVLMAIGAQGVRALTNARSLGLLVKNV